jgi:hypothetical protein
MKLEVRVPEAEREREDVEPAETAMVEHEQLAAAAANEPGAAPALRAWLDELRHPTASRLEPEPVPAPADPSRPAALDYLADAGGAVGIDSASVASADDSDFFFSAARRRSLEEDGLLPRPDPEPDPATTPVCKGEPGRG